MEIVILLAFVLSIVLPTVIMVIGIQKAKKERIEERDEMFYDGDVKFGENPDGTPIEAGSSDPEVYAIDAVEEISKTLASEVENATKPKKKKPAKRKKPEFPIEPVKSKSKSKGTRKPKNKGKKDDDQLLLS